MYMFIVLLCTGDWECTNKIQKIIPDRFLSYLYYCQAQVRKTP